MLANDKEMERHQIGKAISEWEDYRPFFLLLFPCIFPVISILFLTQSHIYMLSELELGSNWLHSI